MEELAALYGGLLKTPPAAVVIEGVWGSGKTALLNAACRGAERQGLLVGRARGRGQKDRSGFAAAREVLASALGAAARSTQEEAVDRAQSLVDSLGRPGSDDTRAVDQLAQALAALGARMLLAIDDAARADADSLRLLDSVVRRVHPGQVLLVVAAEPRLAGGRLSGVDWLLAEPDTRLLALAPLSEDSVRQMCEDFVGVPVSAEWASTVMKVTGGRPSFLLAVIRSMTGFIEGSGGSEADLFEGAARLIVPTVLARASAAGSTCRESLSVAAFLGEGCDLGLIAGVGNMGLDRVADDVDAALRAGLLSGVRPVRFTNPLGRMALKQEVPVGRRTALHRDAARVLDGQGGSEEAVCQHLQLTDPSGDPLVAGRLWRRARVLLEGGDAEGSLGMLERALAEPPASEDLADLLLDTSRAELALGLPAATGHFLESARLGGGDPGRFIATAASMVRRFPTSEILQPDGYRALESAVREFRASGRPVPVEMDLALCRRSRRVTEDALDRFRRNVDGVGWRNSPRVGWADAYLVQEAFRSVGRFDAEAASKRLLRSFDPDAVTGTDSLMAEVHQASGLVLVCCGHFEVADLLERSVERRPATATGESARLALTALSLHRQGRLEDSIGVGRRAVHTDLGGETWSRRVLLASLASSLLERGRVGEAMSLEAALADDPDIGEDWPFDVAASVSRLLAETTRAELWAATGDGERATHHLLAVRSFAAAAGINNPALANWPAVLATVDLRSGRYADAVRTASEYLALARRVGEIRTLSVALVAKAVVTPEEAERLLREAADLLRGSPFRLEEAKTLVQLGRWLLAAGYRDKARSALRSGANLAALCGADGLVASVQGDLRMAGARPRRTALAGWSALTPAEARVAKLAMSGATNARIAQQLYVTEKTVEGHLARVYRKLGVRSRAQLTAPLDLTGAVGEAPLLDGSGSGRSDRKEA